MNRHDRYHDKLRGGNRRRLPILAFVVAAALSIQCDAKLAEFFGLIDDGLVPGQGDIFGRVTVDGSGRSGVTVTVRQGGQVVTTTTTDTNGNYEVLNLDPGAYTVSVTAPTGTTCPGEQAATVVADDETQVNFACTTPPATGIITGTVDLDGDPQGGIPVQLRQGTNVIAETTTENAGGSYNFGNRPVGTYDVAITRATNTTCDGTSTDGTNVKPATVTAGQTTTVNFTCTPQAPGGSPTGDQIQSGWSGNRTLTSQTGSCTPSIAGSFTGSATFDAVNHVIGLVNWDPLVSPISGNDEGLSTTFTSTGTVTLGNGFTVLSDIVGQFRFQGTTPNFTGTLRRRHTPPGGTTPICDELYGVTALKAAPSTSRFKRDVVSLLPEGMTLFGLRPVSFRYLAPYGDPAIPQVGLIAEEVVRVFPAAVALGADGRPFGIQYGTLTGLVIGEIETRARRSMKAEIARMAEALE